MLIVIGDIETITNGDENDFLKNFGVYCEKNAHTICVIGGMMEYDEFEEVQGLCVEEKKRENEKSRNY